MSKRRKAQRAARLLADVELRSANGKATMKDVDFLQRMREINGGRDPYTGVTFSTQSTPVHHNNGKGSQGTMFHTSSYKPTSLSLISNRGEDGVFHCAETSELTKECPIATTPEIYFNNRQWDILLHCTEEYDTEWIALLFGALEEVNGKKTYVIKDFYFPPQTASGAHVDVPVEVKPKPGVIGAIHSHVNMGVFFSGTDVAHSNWPVEVVINRKHEYEAVARHQLKCGEWAKNKAKVFVTGSKLPASIKAQLDLAFSQGAEMEAAKRKKGTKVTVTAQSSTPPPNIPAGVADEDKADVTEAIVKASTSTSTSANLSLCQCGHTEIRHSQGGRTICLDRECKCEAFRPIFHDKGPDEPPCPEKECAREKGHPGWHRDKSGCHFMTKEEQDAMVKVNSEATDDDIFPTGASPEVLALAQGGALDTLLSDAQVADIPDDLEEEDYCPDCNSTGFGSFWDKGKEITIVCRGCKGSGLSSSGIAKIRVSQ